MCFGKSSDKSSKQMVQMQKEEAAAARQKEADRQARITSGIERIKQAFEGTPIYENRAKNYTVSGPAAGTVSGSAVSGLPSGYTYKQITTPGTAGTAGTTGSMGSTANRYATSSQGYSGGGSGHGGASGGATYSLTGGGRSPGGGSMSYTGTPGTPGTAGSSKWVVVGPDGRQYEIGSNIEGSESVFTGRKSGGIDDSFYDDYKGGVIDYYMPQVQEKYKDASDELTYRLARAGLLRSSMANTETTDLSKQNTLNEAKVRNDADKAAADLKSRVAAEKAKAESQLYATENPDVAANQATAAIQNLTAETPDLSPLGDIFTVAAVGGANALKAYQTQNYKKQIPGSQSSSRVI